MTATPATPCKVMTPVSLTATTTGGYRVEYQYKAGYQDTTGGWHWSTIKNYNTTRYCTWTPDTAHTYTLVVYAREVGSTALYNAYQSQTYKVTVQ